MKDGYYWAKFKGSLLSPPENFPWEMVMVAFSQDKQYVFTFNEQYMNLEDYEFGDKIENEKYQ